MKLVVRFVIGDGYTWSSVQTLALECESQEKLICDYEDEVRRAISEYKAQNYTNSSVRFFGKEWSLSYFWNPNLGSIQELEILTLDEWFDLNKVSQ